MRLLAVAVAVHTAVRMGALVVKYPQLSCGGAALLATKLAACCRLLAGLSAPRPLRARP